MMALAEKIMGVWGEVERYNSYTGNLLLKMIDLNACE